MKTRFYYANAQGCPLKRKQLKFRMNETTKPKNQPMKTTNTLNL